MIKRILALALILVMVFAVGCEKTPTSSSSTTTTTTTAAATDTTTEEVTTTASESTTTAELVTTEPPTEDPDEGYTTDTMKKIVVTTKELDRLAPAIAVDKKTIGDTMYSPISRQDYVLKWMDDFNGTTLNMANWSYRSDNSNGGELQKNRAENVSVANGNLLIKAEKLATPIQETKADNTIRKFPYAAGKIDSSGKVFYKYGRFEASIKMPKGKGVWPAFWTMGNGKGWPWGGEIDIIELVGGEERSSDGVYHSAIHWCDPNAGAEAWIDEAQGGAHKAGSGGTYTLPDNDKGKALGDEYQVYGMEWDSRKISFYLNGCMFGRIDVAKDADPTKSVAFHIPHFVILNFALGGWPPAPDATTVFPQTMKVDWVKIWQVKK